MLATLSAAAVLSAAAGCQSKEDKLYEAVERLCEHAQEFEGTKEPFEPALELLSRERDRGDEAVERLWAMRDQVSIKTRWSRLVEAMGGRTPSCEVVVNAWEKRAPTIELDQFQFLCEDASEPGPGQVELALRMWSSAVLDAATREVWDEVKDKPSKERWGALVAALRKRGHDYSCEALERYWNQRP